MQRKARHRPGKDLVIKQCAESSASELHDPGSLNFGSHNAGLVLKIEVRVWGVGFRV